VQDTCSAGLSALSTVCMRPTMPGPPLTLTSRCMLMMQVNRDVPPDPLNNVFTEWTETHLFNFTPFSHPLKPDATVADSRPVYGALNMYRSSGGNPFCGPVAAVLSSPFIGTNALMSPMDSGLFSTCRFGDAACTVNGQQTTCICTAWPEPRALGLLGGRGTMQHLLLPYLMFYNHTEPLVGSEYPYYNLARIVTRIMSRRTYGAGRGRKATLAAPMPLNMMENLYGYFEVSGMAIHTTCSDNCYTNPLHIDVRQ
jgi:hypothetical protein